MAFMPKSKQTSPLTTVGDILHWATAQFEAADLYYGHGTDNPWDEAVALVLHVLQLPPDTSQDILTATLTPLQRDAITALVKTRALEHVPAAYLIQQAWFAGMPFFVDPRVIIPRSPIAELIEAQFSPWIRPDKVHRILDLCTGSGCIAIACAMEFPHAQVDGADISDDALAVAAINVKQHRLVEHVRLFKSDLFAGLPQEKYDIIVSNPPYVSRQEMAELPTEYKHEPELALVAGSDGLDLAIKILQRAGQYLTDHGILIVEVGNSEEALRERFPHVPFTWLEFARGGGGVFLLTAEQVGSLNF